MRALILVAGAALALSACTTIQHGTTAERIDLGCELAVLTAQTTGAVADVARAHGADPVTASKVAARAAEGEDVTRLVCGVASAIGSLR